MKKIILIFTVLIFQLSFSQNEKHLKNITQLTFGGDNAEAYFSFDSKNLSFQSNYKKWGVNCDQIFMMNISDASKDTLYKPSRISTGKGRTTCAYFLPDGNHILYASTHKAGENCPETGDLRKNGKYLWNIFSSYDIFIADLKGNITKQLTDSPGYDAEATISPKGDKIEEIVLDQWFLDG